VIRPGRIRPLNHKEDLPQELPPAEAQLHERLLDSRRQVKVRGFGKPDETSAYPIRVFPLSIRNHSVANIVAGA
jgi:hypothetical protein